MPTTTIVTVSMPPFRLRRQPNLRDPPQNTPATRVSRFGGVATIVSRRTTFSTFRGEGVEPDLVALPVGLRFDVSGDECRSATS